MSLLLHAWPVTCALVNDVFVVVPLLLYAGVSILLTTHARLSMAPAYLQAR